MFIAVDKYELYWNKTNMIQVYVVVDKETLYMTNSVQPNLFVNSDFFGNLNVPAWYGCTKALRQ